MSPRPCVGKAREVWTAKVWTTKRAKGTTGPKMETQWGALGSEVDGN